MNADERFGRQAEPYAGGRLRDGTYHRRLAEALTRSLSPQTSHETLDGALRDWARTLRTRGVKPEHMVATLRELWYQCGGQSLHVPDDQPVPLTLGTINETALRAYFQDD